MPSAHPTRAHASTPADSLRPVHSRSRRVGSLLSLLFLLLGISSQAQTASPTYQITSVAVTSNGYGGVLAGQPGVALEMTGTLPTAAQQAQTSLLACFYTGYGSTTGFPLSLPDTQTTEPLTVPASTIQSIPQTIFTSANNYTLTGYLYFIASGNPCDGTYDSTLTNRIAVSVFAPGLLSYSGPISIPKTNSATGVQAPPTFLTLPARFAATNLQGTTAPSAITFGTFGSVPTVSNTPLTVRVPVPPAFSSSAVGTTTSLGVCTTFGTTSTCTTPTPAITLTVTALAPSTGTLTATPSPATTAGQTVLTAQFAKTTSSTANPGAPSGAVTFVAGATTLPPANLILDKTATFTAQTTSLTVPTTATPVITPAAGPYLNSATVGITDATSGASIFYTQDGSAPTTGSTPYTAPFQITASQTVQAIAVSTSSLPSAVASSAYIIAISNPAKLAFTVQPVSTTTSAVITPTVKVAIEDANGYTVNTSTLPVTLTLANNTAQSTLGGTTTVNAVNGIATFPDLTVNNVATGYTLAATSGSLTGAASTAFNITPGSITLTPQSGLIGITSTLTGTVTLGQPAPAGGIVVALSSSTPANVTVSPASVTVAQGQTTATFTYTAVTAGPATLSGSATNYTTGTVTVTGTAAQVSLGTIPPVAPGQMVSLALSLAMVAPTGGTTVTFTSSNTNVATVTSSIFVPAGQRTAATNPQITGNSIGTTTIIASAPGYAPDTRAVNVTVVATFSPTSPSIDLGTYTNATTLNISAPAQTGGITFTLSSDDTTKVTVTPSVTIAAGTTSAPLTLTGLANGSTTIRADSAGVTEATTTVNVSSLITPNQNVVTGVNLQGSVNFYLPVAPPSPVTLTVTTNAPAIATLSKSATVVGTTSVTFTNITSAGYVGTIYVQGQSLGTATLTASAPGYTNGTSTVTVDATGFGGYYSGQNLMTTTFSAPTSFTIYPLILDPKTFTVLSTGQINPGVAPINVPATSSNTSVGTITTSPIVFVAGDTYETSSFQPTGAGTTTITVGTPAGYSTPATSTTATVTVSAPVITASQNVTTGVNLQGSVNFYLPVAPPTPVTLTVTSSGATIATLSKSATVVGGTSVTFTNITSAGYVGTISVQGQSTGSATLTASAPGYTSGTSTVTVDPSGFGFYYYNQSNTTTTFSTPTTLTVYPLILTPNTLGVVNIGQLNPGIAPVSVPVTSSATAVGTITTSPVVLNPSDSSDATSFQPVSAGTSTVTLGTPAGYSTPASNTTASFTVSAPAITANQNVTTGVNLQGSVNFYLPVAPPNPITVTVTSGGPTIATLSKSATVVGGTSVTFTNVTSAGYVGTIYVQGQSTGSATLTASAPGYTSGTSAVTVDASGFGFYYNNQSNTTTTFSPATALTVYPLILTPGTLAVVGPAQLNPGIAPISVPITSSATSVGTITTSPIVFNPADSSEPTSFQPVSAGTSTVTVGTPAGFSTPAGNTTTSFTVSAPVITVNQNVTTGVNLQGTVNFSLPVAPPNPVTVTVVSNGPIISTLSKSATTVGGTSVTFTNVTSAGYVGTIYVQGQTTGTTTLTASAPGYTNGTSNVTVDPSGFGFSSSNQSISTTTFATPSGLNIYPLILTPGTLTSLGNAQLNPGLGAISVPVTSSATAVGTITTSPVVFNGGDTSQSTSFQPQGNGTATITVGTPPGFSTPSANTTQPATVTSPVITSSQNVTTGVNLENTVNFYVPVAPPSPVTVTVTINAPGVATLSKSASAVGATTLTYTNVSAAGYLGSIYVQGQSVGSATITASAPGYTSGTSAVTVDPSAFGYYNNQSFSTTTFSASNNLNIYPLILTPGTLTLVGTAQVNPGLSAISVPVTSSSTTVGTVTSPVVFHGGETSLPTTFQPKGNGTSTISLTEPSGFSTPSDTNQTAATATVSAPVITANQNVTTGANFQGTVNFYLPQAPPSAVTMTVVSSAPAISTLSKSATTAGGTSVTFANLTSAGYAGTIYVQGQATGTATLTASAPGYTSGTSTVTVDPSGFGFASSNQTFSTTTFSAATGLTIYPLILASGSLTSLGTGQLNPGIGPISVPVVSSSTSIGTITTSPVVFNGGDTFQNTSFKPQGNGSSTITVGTPQGFSTPSANATDTATVSAPVITVNNQSVIVGANLQGTVNFYLPAAPPSPVTVTVTIDTPASATLSTSSTVVGTTTITYTNVSSAGYLGTIYVQGQATGTATITASAPGFTSGTSAVSVYPSGFSFYPSSSSFSTTATSGATTLYVYTATLNPGVLTIYTYGQSLNPGLGTISIPVTSSLPSVGAITTSPVVFKAGDGLEITTFKPAASGTSTITIGAPPAGYSTPSQTQYTQITATVQ